MNIDNWFYWGNLVLSYGVSGYVMFQFMHAMYTPKYSEKWKYTIVYLFFVVLAIYLNILGNPIIKTFFGMFAMCIISLCLYKSDSNKMILIYSLLYFLYLIWVDVLAVLGITLATKLTILNVRESNSLLFLTGVFGQILMLGSYRLVIVLFQKHHINSITLKQNLFLIILALFEVVLVTYIALKVAAETSGVVLMFITVCLLGVDLYLIKLFEEISQKYLLEKEVILRDQQTAMQNNYYNSLETQYEHSRRLIHDMKNHIQTLEELYRLDNRVEASKYTQVILNTMDSMGSRFKCNNRVLTIIINDKLLKCDSKEIVLNTEIEDLDLAFIDPFDMTTIFSNLLDNAIEACEEVEIKKRKIDLRIVRFNDFITISIKNNCRELIIFNEKNVVSTKNGKHMGFGLKNVKVAIEKYDGSIQYNNNNGVFEVNILMLKNNT